MMNKGQKHKSKNTKSTKNTKNQKTTKTRKSKNKNKKQTKQVQLPKPEGGRKEKGKRTKGGEWCPVVSGALCMGVRSAQFESCMKPGVRFMELGAVPWMGW